MSLRVRLTLSAAAAVAVAVALASAAAYFVVRAELRDEVDSSLYERAASITERGPFGRGFPRIPAPLLGGPGGYVQLVGASGATVRQPGADIALPVDDGVRSVAAGTHDAFYEDADVAGTHVRVLTVPFREGLALQIARPLTEVDDILDRMRLILLVVALAGVGVAALLGLGVAEAALVPARRLTETAERITATGDLSRRVETDRQDELGRLAASFNTMLAALEESVQAQRQLVADASHELRTPLTSLRTNVELLSRADGLPQEEREQALRDVTAQLEELSVLVGDVVELARDGEPQQHLEEVRLDLLVADAVERARLHAPQVVFATDLDETIVRGAPERLYRAVGNILDNAAEWSPPGGTVEVGVRDGEISVRDHGPGIAPEDLPRVFERFYRSAAARSRPGSGLGLAIVRQVAEAHGGAATAETADDGGTIVRLKLTPTS